MSKLNEITTKFTTYIYPEHMEEGVLYISKRYGVAIHLCACGCKGQTVTPINVRKGDTKGWNLTEHENGVVSLSPSIGNFSGEKPYHAHYFITKNKIKWCK